MSGDFFLLILTALATAYGFWASLKDSQGAAAWAAALLFLVVGMVGALAVTLSGAGEILPGHQLDPKIQAYWAKLIEDGEMLAPRPEYLLVSILATILAITARPGKAATMRVLPALLAFVAIFFAVRNPDPIGFARADHQGSSAFLTMIREGRQTRLLFSVGEDDQVFLPVLYEHTAPGVPPKAALWWSRDGEVVTFTTRSGKPFFAVDREGNPTGWLPVGGDSWPERGKGAADSVEYQRKVSTARVEVARLLDEHGGPARK